MKSLMERVDKPVRQKYDKKLSKDVAQASLPPSPRGGQATRFGQLS
jgi:hypothetical protein